LKENQYKRIADEYLRAYGAELRSELEDPERRPLMRDEISFDLRMRREIAALKRPRYKRYAGLIAACLAIALLTPLVLRLYPGSVGAPGSDSYSPAPTASSEASPAASPEAPSASSPVEPYEILPLSFTIPDRFSVMSVEQDVNKTVYRLNDNKLDDVVITLERSGDLSRYDTLTELTIRGNSAFGSSGNGYNLLTFKDEGSDILYVLTCKYDINTLVLMGNSIMV